MSERHIFIIPAVLTILIMLLALIPFLILLPMEGEGIRGGGAILIGPFPIIFYGDEPSAFILPLILFLIPLILIILSLRRRFPRVRAE